MSVFMFKKILLFYLVKNIDVKVSKIIIIEHLSEIHKCKESDVELNSC